MNWTHRRAGRIVEAHHSFRRTVGGPRKDSLRPARSGWTLIELLATISVLGVVMTLSGLLFVAMSRSERTALRSSAAQQTLARLNEQFRRDVHQADAAEILETEPGQFTLTLAAANRPVAMYAIQSHELRRLAAVPDGEHRETYRIPGAAWSFQRSSERVPKVSLSLLRPADTLTVTSAEFLPVVEWRLEAVLALNSMSAVSKEQP